MLDYNIDNLLTETPVQKALNEPVPSSQSAFYDGVAPSSLISGDLQGNTTVQAGYLQSSNFETGSAGWQLTPTSAELNVSTALNSLDIPDTTTASSFHVNSDGDAWWGATAIGSAVAKILATGIATFTNIIITGGSVSGTPISAIPNTTATDISLLTLTHNLTFSSTDTDTVAWSSGTITLSNGRTFTISGGNTGNIAAKTYIYLDPGASSTVLQTTTTFSAAVGANKQLIAIAVNDAAGATFQVHGGAGGININADNLNVSTLSAITADLGSVTAGTVTGATVRTSSSNPKVEMTSATLQAINASGNTIFEVITSGGNTGDIILGDDATGSYAMWDQSAGQFKIFNAEGAGVNVQTFSSSGTWTKPSQGTYARVQMWGAGASGACSVSSDPASGGGGGEYTEKIFLLSALGSTETVTIGTGGTAIVSTSLSGNAGGNSTFGTHLTANGGSAGQYNGSTVVAGGTGGDSISYGSPYAGTGAEGVENGLYAGAGGGVNSGASFTARGGGKSIFGGGGGGAARGGNSIGAGGTSKNAGNGGAGSRTNGVNATAGTAPAGGGGAFHLNGGSANSGAGANGYGIVTVF